MRPDSETNNAFLYCLALATKQTGVEIIFFLAMSNHYHAGLVDKTGRLPEFLEAFHKLFAKHQNALRGRGENFWAAEQTSVVELVEAKDVLDKMVYTLTNPVKADLVALVKDWPGVSSYAAHLGKATLRAVRPVRFFRKEGEMPKTVSLTVGRPTGWDALTEAEFRRLLNERIEGLEQVAAQRRAESGVRVLGRRGVLQQDWRAQPQTQEPRGRLKPRLACKNVWRRVETLQRNRAFLTAYRTARELWLAGTRALFPAGTYWLRRFAGATCEPAETAA
jgi:hypothetical protein